MSISTSTELEILLGRALNGRKYLENARAVYNLFNQMCAEGIDDTQVWMQEILGSLYVFMDKLHNAIVNTPADKLTDDELERVRKCRQNMIEEQANVADIILEASKR